VHIDSRPEPEHDTFNRFLELERGRLQKHASGALADALGYALPGESSEQLERIAQEDQRRAQRGMVRLKVGQEGSYKHIDELTREDRQARIAAELAEVKWLNERVKLLKEGAEGPPIPTHLR
jgi:hypothetical protein